MALLAMVPVPGSEPADDGALNAAILSEPRTDERPHHFLLDPELAPLRADRSGSSGDFETASAPFDVALDGHTLEYEVMAVTVLPGVAVDVSVPGPEGPGGYGLRFAEGELLETTVDGWRWRAPTEPGISALRVEAEGSTDVVHVNVMVLHPREHVTDDRLHGYRIGRYQERPLRGDPAYIAPEGFVEVPAEAEDVLVSPHFTVGQFLSKQPGDPRFLALSMPLVRKLEAILARANQSGIETPTFHVMSGFRTPWYNASIGNKTIYSRHLWGDAADIFVDVDGNHDMDDLNGDGRADAGDARLLADLVEEVESSGRPEIVAGGIGLYRRAAHRGPFVHVDARGHAARW
ncbi:MAG: hypothetical protein OEN56_13520 [Gemmatimonadota bacterium]|nr:hypothetical protein [Gemmatimonadota bacterium]